MAPAKNPKPTEQPNPWGWISEVRPEEMSTMNVYQSYRIVGYQTCKEMRNCKKNPYCLWGLGDKKWKDESEGENDDDQVTFRTEGEYAGIQNLGATCYVNSLLQLWFHNPIFRPAILKWTPSLNPEELEEYMPKCPLAQLQAIFARLKISKRSKINPSEFVSSLQLNTGEQQDAQEFAKLFMDYIVKLLSDYGNEYIKKLIAQSANGQLQYETECLGCNNKTRRPEAFTELNLSVKKNLIESLDDLLADEIISDEYMCSNCQKKNTAKRRMQLLTLPPILNLQLLRFVYDREAQRRKKVTQVIQFPEVLNLQEKVYQDQDQDNPEMNGDSLKYKYHLTAVLIHNGPSASSGHYIAQIKDLKTGDWLKFNDEFVDPLNKGKTQKPKDEESGDDDGEKKSKTKKAKNTPNLSSAGAYMLVYTSEECINNREPDPELHKYLIDLVHREDASFEAEVKKTKNEKDYELQERNQRRKEVEWLYEFGQYAKLSDDNPDSDTEEPKAKMARLDPDVNSVLVAAANSDPILEGISDSDKNKNLSNIVKSESENTNNGHKTNGISSDYPLYPPLPTRKKNYQIEESDFVFADWVSQWLDPVNPVPPIENTPLLCEHKKLAPPAPGSNPCLYRIIPSPLADVWYEHYNGSPRLTSEDLCYACVETQCRRLRALAQLEEDFKQVNEFIKKFDDECRAIQKSAHREKEADQIEKDACWITKENLKNWKKLAKETIEGPNQGKSKKCTDDNGNGSEIEEVDNEEEEPIANGPFNANVMCVHGSLCPETHARKAIPMAAWRIIAKYFKDPFTIEMSGNDPCPECQNQEQANSIAVQQSKEIAAKQKSDLNDLCYNRNRPELDETGELYIVSHSFVSAWRRYVKDPVRNDIITEINNQSLVCEHRGFMFPLNLMAEYLKTDETHEDLVVLVTPREWKLIQANFKPDIEIKLIITNPNSNDGFHYTPEVCNVCTSLWLEGAYSRQFEYNDCPIYIVKREKGEKIESEEEEAKEVKNSQTIVTGKREIKPTNPNAWMAGYSQPNVRRSQRPRSSKSERTYKVNSTITVKELKSKICADFKTLLSDQHLFYEERELTDLTKSLRDYKIPARAKLYLEIDTAENGSLEELVATVETGFQGTLLIGGSGLGDTRSPVQNI